METLERIIAHPYTQSVHTLKLIIFMLLPKPIHDNLQFLVAETRSQMTHLGVLFETASAPVARRVLDRRSYSYNLKMRIHDGCVDALRHSKKSDKEIFSLRAAEAISADLARLTDIGHDCVQLIGKLSRLDALRRSPTSKLLRDICGGIDLIEPAIAEHDTRTALKISAIEKRMDRAFDKQFRTLISGVKQKRMPQDAIIAVMIAQRIEEMGDVLRNISESIISAKMGQTMRMDRFHALSTAIDDLGFADAHIDPIAETKSGSGISGIAPKQSEDAGYAAIFKDGQKDKLSEEKDSVESWHDLYPGLAPQILSYKKQGKNAALLIEHLPGLTFEQVLLQDNDQGLSRTTKQLTKTLRSVWQDTKRKKPTSAAHMTQLSKRLEAVLSVHPHFDLPRAMIGAHQQKSLRGLISSAEKREHDIQAPFSVYIHGDFNLDNIICDADAKKIRFIDLHRSCFQDYTQDVSVFMVSCYRLQVLDPQTRQRIQFVAEHMHDFASKFAHKQSDKTFEVRLALGLARSFITSTRFILDRTLARDMLLRGVYILERLDALSAKKIAHFQLPIEEIFA